MARLTAEDFCRGILGGLSLRGRASLSLLSAAGHAAARAAFEYLEKQELPLRLGFVINLHPIYGESGDWTDAVRYYHQIGWLIYEGEGAYRLALPDLPFEELLGEGIGDPELWRDCASRFIDTFLSAR